MSPRQTETARRQERVRDRMTRVWQTAAAHHIRDDWYVDARCRGIDTIVFVGSDEETDGPGQPRDLIDGFRQAQKICAGCPVRLDCLAYAVRTRSYGVWGGERFGAQEVAALNRISVKDVA